MSSNVSSSKSTAWQTALTSARSSNVTQNSQDSTGYVEDGSASQPTSTYATMARIARAGGYGSSSYNVAQPPRPPSSVASSSSSCSSPNANLNDPSTREDRHSTSTSRNASSNQSYASRASSSGWQGSANVRGPNSPSAATHGQTITRSSSRSSSAVPPSTYANASLPRNTSQSGLSSSESEANGYSSRSHRGGGGFSSSRSQTSVESDNPLAIAAHESNLLRAVATPVQSNAHEWEEAYRAVRIGKGKMAADEAELAAGIEALGLNPDFTEKRPASNLPPPPSSGAWSFKKSIPVPRGSTVEPEKLAGPTPEYLETAASASKVEDLSYFVGKRPKLLVLDLNQTLVARKKASSQASRNAIARPYLSAFLEYICGSDEVSPGVYQRRFNVMIWSSAEADNVRIMCENIGFFTALGTQAPLLVEIWDRGSMDLTLEQFNSKYPTIKDLTKIWRVLKWNPVDPASPNPGLLAGHCSNGTGQSSSGSVVSSLPPPTFNGYYASPSPSPAPSSASASSASTLNTTSYRKKDLRWSQHDTILIDDTPSKACLQPHNHLWIPSWRPPSKAAISPSTSYGFGPAGGRDGLGVPKTDTCLLQLVEILERLRRHTNVSRAIKLAQFDGLGSDGVGDAWAKKGLEVLKEKGIKPMRDFNPLWAMNVLSKTAPANGNAVNPHNGTMPLSPVTPGVQIGWD